MPDDQIDTTIEDQSTSDAPVVEQEPATGDTLGDAGKAALAAERRARREAEKQLKAYEDRLRVIEDKDKTDLERAQERIAELERVANTSTAELLRYRVAGEFSIPADYLDLLTATDEETLRSQAEKVANLVAANAKQPPAPLPGQGKAQQPDSSPSVSTGAALYRQRNNKT